MAVSKDTPLPFAYQFVAGGIAGVTEIVSMYPLDVVKTRFQLQVGNAKDGYTSILDCLTKIVKNEGVGRLYRGVLPPIFIEAPKRAIKFAAFEEYKALYKNLNSEGKLTQPLLTLSAVSAGITEATIVVPFDLIKIRMQDKANASKYLNTTDCFLKIVRQEGPLALFNGIESTMWRHGTWTGLYFTCIGNIKSVLPKPKNSTETTGINFIAGAIGGTIGTMANTPFDVVKTRIQNQIVGQPQKYKWTIPSTILIYKEEGFKALYKGFAPKVLRLGPGGGILLVVFDVVSNYMREHFM
jgi:solute carrier family 25 2-oxodicarboxylate transporter 21